MNFFKKKILFHELHFATSIKFGFVLLHLTVPNMWQIINKNSLYDLHIIYLAVKFWRMLWNPSYFQLVPISVASPGAIPWSLPGKQLSDSVPVAPWVGPSAGWLRVSWLGGEPFYPSCHSGEEGDLPRERKYKSFASWLACKNKHDLFSVAIHLP